MSFTLFYQVKVTRRFRCGRRLPAAEIHDQPRSTLSCEIGPDPLQEDAHTEIGLGQKLEMHTCPGEPGREPTDTET